jgi:hypothetical protein
LLETIEVTCWPGNQPVTVEYRNVRIGRAHDHVGAVDNLCRGISGDDFDAQNRTHFRRELFSVLGIDHQGQVLQ